MNIISPKAEFLWATPDIALQIERATRTCYKSEDKIKDGSAEKLFNKVIRQTATPHDSVCEHGVISMRVFCDRATHTQFIRHRHFSFSVESQRYVNYAKDRFGGQITVIEPFDLTRGTIQYEVWLKSMHQAEENYVHLIKNGVLPQTARSVLPNSVKTEFVVTGNVRQWRHFFSLRLSNHAQNDIRYVATEILREMFDNGIPMFLFEDVM